MKNNLKKNIEIEQYLMIWKDDLKNVLMLTELLIEKNSFILQ
jgi:hypothetical protein